MSIRDWIEEALEVALANVKQSGSLGSSYDQGYADALKEVIAQLDEGDE